MPGLFCAWCTTLLRRYFNRCTVPYVVCLRTQSYLCGLELSAAVAGLPHSQRS